MPEVDEGSGAPESSLYLHQHDAWVAQEILKLLDLWSSLSSPMAGLAVLGGQQGPVFVGLSSLQLQGIGLEEPGAASLSCTPVTVSAKARMLMPGLGHRGL